MDAVEYANNGVPCVRARSATEQSSLNKSSSRYAMCGRPGSWEGVMAAKRQVSEAKEPTERSEEGFEAGWRAG